MGVFHHLAGHFDVFLKAVFAAVDHDRGEAAVDAGLAHVEVLAVVQVQGDGQVGVGDGGLYQLGEIDMLGIFPRAGGHLQDDGRPLRLGGFGDALDDLHIIDVEGADGVTAGVGFLKHFFGGDQWHDSFLLVLDIFILPPVSPGCNIDLWLLIW